MKPTWARVMGRGRAGGVQEGGRSAKVGDQREKERPIQGSGCPCAGIGMGPKKGALVRRVNRLGRDKKSEQEGNGRGRRILTPGLTYKRAHTYDAGTVPLFVARFVSPTTPSHSTRPSSAHLACSRLLALTLGRPVP
ncbi:Hypothetical protein NTJ_03164 [Nesidiocoris tenuis]|uniref:Uncharacterized protein n=1 Tax=Nesidiocoris tenuis TaxID=355587 RepID=A0ABN7ADH9_9HEMI|nr:Hypothetical protein NTJ_03164 [Nesidiocoris tenuis]